MKGYLKNPDNSTIQLKSHTTTVGRAGCDIVINDPTVNPQHAMIEPRENERCYIIKDLNTTHGTYVNECLIQNAILRLNPGDAIRFGCNTQNVFQLHIDDQYHSPPQLPQQDQWSGQDSTTLPPISSSVSTVQPNQQFSQHGATPMGGPGQTLPGSTTSTWIQGRVPSAMPPRPPMKPRPVSAGSLPRRLTVGPIIGTRPLGQDESAVDNAMMQGYTYPTGWYSGDTAVTQPGRIVGLGATSAGSVPSVDSATYRIPPSFIDSGTYRIPPTSVDSGSQRVMSDYRSTDLSSATEISYLEKELQQRDSTIAHQQQNIIKLQQSLKSSGDSNLIYQIQNIEHKIEAKNEIIQQLKEQVINLSTAAAGTASDPSSSDGSAELKTCLIQKASELVDIRSQMEKLMKNSDDSSMLVTTLQRDLNKRCADNDYLIKELEDMKRQLREKDVELSAMSAKFTRVKDFKKMEDELEGREKEMSSYRIKLKEAEDKSNQHADFILSIENELKRAKDDIETERQTETVLRVELNKSKATADDLEMSLKDTVTQLGEFNANSASFRETVLQIVFSVPGVKLPNDPSSVNDEELFDLMRKASEERIETQRKNRELKENLRTSEQNSKETNNSLKKLNKNMTEFTHHLQDEGRSSNALRAKITEMESMTVDEGLKFIKEACIDVLFGELSWQQPIDEALLKAGFNQELVAKTPAKQIGVLHTKLLSTEAASDDLRSQLATVEDKNNLVIEALIERLEQSNEQQRQFYDSQIDEIKVKHEEDICTAVSAIGDQLGEQQEMNMKIDTELRTEKQRIIILKGQINDLTQLISNKDVDFECQLEKSEDLLNQFKKSESDLKFKLTEMEQHHVQEIQSLKLNKKNDKDLASYKEQVHQHSLTIVAMEDKLLAANKQIKEMNLESTLKEQIIQEYEQRLEKRASKPAPPPKPVIVPPPKTMQDLYAMEQLVLVLRRESAESKRTVAVRDDTIHSLNRDLAGANAKLSDLTSELSEKQKEELERSRAFLKDQNTELTTQRSQLANLTELIETQRREINKLHKQLKHINSTSSDKDNVVSDLRLELSQTKGVLEETQTHSHKQLQTQENEGKITSELTSIGAQCRGEHHEQVITRQKEALSDLRQRIRLLEQNRPPLPNQDQALQHVAVLKRELNDLRAQQGGRGRGSRDVPEPDIGREQVMDLPTSEMGLESTLERSARLETLEALETSEKTYLDLNRAMTNTLNITTIKGQRSMMHQPRDEREKLCVDREKDSELMKGKIQSLCSRIERKDELLNSYEGDLAHLRDIEKIVEKKMTEVDSIQNEMRTRNQEIECVREALRRTKDEFEREKRLNAAIKSKKTFHIEHTEQVGHGWPKHYCEPEEINGKAEVHKKGQNDKLKKKLYEVERLKEDLHRKDQQITDMAAKIINLEHGMGLSGDV